MLPPPAGEAKGQPPPVRPAWRLDSASGCAYHATDWFCYRLRAGGRHTANEPVRLDGSTVFDPVAQAHEGNSPKSEPVGRRGGPRRRP
jgi:hypothetical protein